LQGVGQPSAERRGTVGVIDAGVLRGVTSVKASAIAGFDLVNSSP
jgi:hypothetical protein